MTGEKSSSDNESGKVNGAQPLHRSETAATAAAFDIEHGNPYLIRDAPLGSMPPPPPPGLQAMYPNATVASEAVHDAYRASSSLQCAAILDCLINVLSAVSWFLLWGLLFLLLVPFGLVGRAAAARYATTGLFKVYLGYIYAVIALHITLAAVLFFWTAPFDGAFELFKAAIYAWIAYLNLKYQTCVSALSPEDRIKLQTQRFTIARTEHLVFIQ